MVAQSTSSTTAIVRHNEDRFFVNKNEHKYPGDSGCHYFNILVNK